MERSDDARVFLSGDATSCLLRVTLEGSGVLVIDVEMPVDVALVGEQMPVHGFCDGLVVFNGDASCTTDERIGSNIDFNACNTDLYIDARLLRVAIDPAIGDEVINGKVEKLNEIDQ
ncbi:hypothetical protein TSUD_55410 [Trifolium subterraneum]|uniref:Uncharacterized protein n=1 Tax=Trifolium subterraneum TaxID=3900 RepID=A0A2Z6NG56_TRISU|nr:hypothetical protein TSUD_55410 [Trifolium subterraneum]